jgi:arylsulfatase A-like enzyme
MRALPLAGLAAGFLLAAASSSCRGLSHPSPKVLLITLDTTRADHLGCYGDTGAMTPNLDAFAKEAVRFDQAMTSVPVTLPSHATMFTGVDPPVHGVRYNGMFKLGAQSVTIAERLREAGFQTGAVPAAFPVNAKSGLGQGFAIYRDLFSEPGADKLKSTESRKAADVTRLGLEWVRSAAKGPFFGWLHYYDAHYPYEPPFPFSSRFRDHPYDGEIAYVDAQLGELFAGLKREGIWDDLTVVIVGDHGEGLYEHGERMHAQLAYQSTLRVPLLIKSPGARRGSVISEPVTLADIAPTILDLAGRPVPEGLDGFSLRSALGGAALPRRTLYFETLAGSLAFGWSPIEGVRRGKWKLIRSSDPELYDLDADPGEANNVFAAEGSVVADLSAILDEAIARWGKTSAPAEATAAPLDAEELSRLTSLGYVGGSVTAARRGGPSPRSMEHLESELLLLQDMMEQRRYRDVLVSAANVLKDDPGNRLVLGGAAESSASTRDFATAERYGIELATRYPEYVPGVVTLGRIYVGEAKYGEAEKVFRTGL